ncbi:MAG TPA: hypothetical protein VN845_01155 [Solirubrobacteraceae bacterium]|nr:hypothetical protein [Solirubrobacteraceae bacterium]
MSLVDPPEVRVLDERSAVCFLRLACCWHQPVGAVRELDPQYVNVLLLGGYALKIARYLYAERRVVVDGTRRSAQWETADAREHEEVCVLARRVEFLGPPPWEFERARRREDRFGEVWRSSGDGALLAPGERIVGFSEDVWL